MSFRPYTVKLKTPGQCTFAYMSQEAAEEYEKVLKNYEAGLEATKDSGSPLESVALSLVQNPETKAYELVTIRFNRLTRETKFDSIKEVATLKNRAVDEFKKALIRNKLV